MRKRKGRFCAFEPVERRLLFTTIYVDANTSGGTHDGAAWSSAFADLQQALAIATPGDDIHIADGAYKPSNTGDKTATFYLKNQIVLLGGFAGDGAANPDARDTALFQSILSGQITLSNDPSLNSLVVVSGSGTNVSAVLDGCTITGGARGMVSSSGSPTVRNCVFSGVGMRNVAASPVVDDCSFIKQGMENVNGSSPIITRCTFLNIDSELGGAIYNDNSSGSVTDCTFVNDYGSSGAGGVQNDNSSSGTFTRCIFTHNFVPMENRNSSPTLIDCVFSRNVQVAAVVNENSSPTLTRCTFDHNWSYGNGAALSNKSGSSPLLHNCVFTGNTSVANQNGGAIYNAASSPVLMQCMFAGNSAGQGAGIFSTLASTVTLFDCTFAWNDGGTGRSIYNQSSSTTATNCVFWGPSTPIPEVYAVSGTLNVAYSDIRDGLNGIGNVAADPGFARNPNSGQDGTWGTTDDDYGDLRLQATSPAIDAGSNSPVPAGVTTDLAGNPRIVDAPNIHDYGAIVDMGAYERTVAMEYLFSAAKPSLRVVFDMDVNPATLDATDLTLRDVGTGLQEDFAAFATVTYDAPTRTAIWVFAHAVPDGDYRATIAAGSVADTLGSALPADVLGNFFVLAGDANRDRKVDINDLGILAMNWSGSGKVFSQGDFNYDGKVDAADLGILSANWQKSQTPPVAPAAPVSLTPVTPKRTATRVVSLIL